MIFQNLQYLLNSNRNHDIPTPARWWRRPRGMSWDAVLEPMVKYIVPNSNNRGRRITVVTSWSSRQAVNLMRVSLKCRL